MGRMRPAFGLLAEVSRLLGECDNPEIHAAQRFPWARHGVAAKVIISGGASQNDHLLVHEQLPLLFKSLTRSNHPTAPKISGARVHACLLSYPCQQKQVKAVRGAILRVFEDD